MSKNLIFISGPQKNMLPGYWLYDYLVADGYKITSFYLRKDDAENPNGFVKWKRLLCIIFHVLFRVKSDDIVLAYDCGSSLYVALCISVFRPSLFMYKINAMANNSQKLYSRWKSPFVRLAYTHIYTTVNNKRIAELYASFLNLPIEHFIPIPDSLSDFGDSIMKIENREEKDYVFMGGATHRDFALVVECARELPYIPFEIVTFNRFRNFFVNAPSNIHVQYGLEESAFYNMIAHSNIVFIPLTNDMQGGQMTLFQGALLEKPIVTTYSMAIETYFDSNAVSLIEIGNKEQACSILADLWNNRKKREKRGKAAKEQISKFTTASIYELYKEKLLPH